MAKIKITVGGKEVEIEGNLDELYYLVLNFAAYEREREKRSYKPIEMSKTEEPVKLPSVEEIIQFLESKGGNFKHTFGEIQQHFLGREYRASNKQEHPMFERFYIRVAQARKIIEGKYEGEWQVEVLPKRKRRYWLKIVSEQPQNINI